MFEAVSGWPRLSCHLCSLLPACNSIQPYELLYLQLPKAFRTLHRHWQTHLVSLLSVSPSSGNGQVKRAVMTDYVLHRGWGWGGAGHLRLPRHCLPFFTSCYSVQHLERKRKDHIFYFYWDMTWWERDEIWGKKRRAWPVWVSDISLPCIGLFFFFLFSSLVLSAFSFLDVSLIVIYAFCLVSCVCNLSPSSSVMQVWF